MCLQRKGWSILSLTPLRPHTLNTWQEAQQYFTDLIVIAERIEQAVRGSKILDPSKKKGFDRRKKEIEVYNIKDENYKGKKKNQ